MPVVDLPKKKAYWGMVIAVTVSLLVIALHSLQMLQRLEWISYDERMRFSRSHATLHQDVAVVLIDEASIKAMNPVVGRWPWPRSVYAKVIEFFQAGGAKAVVFDLLLGENEEATHRDPGRVNESDMELVRATAGAHNVIHAAQIIRELEDDAQKSALNEKIPEDFRSRFALHEASGFPNRGSNDYALPFTLLYEASRGVGVVSVDADDDNVFRRTHPFYYYAGDIYPALSVAPLVALDPPDRIVYQGDSVLYGRTVVPLDGEGRMLVNMVSDRSTYSISGILDSIIKMEAGDIEGMKVSPYEFAGKIVFIGASAIGLADIKATPLSAKTPGVMIHASVTSNFLSGDFLTPVAPALTRTLVVIFAFITVFTILVSHRLGLQILAPLLLVSGFTALSYYGFEQGVVYEMAPPAAAVTFAWLSTFAFLAFTEGKDKRRVRSMLSQYVSPAVLAEVVDRYEDQIRAEVGRREHLSILFSDVRGFTSLSEQLQAEQVVELLNIHFSVMTEVIFRHQGTLDKFIGDAIMAFWGAPIHVKDHANRAVRAALEMSRSLNHVNAQLAEKGYPSIDIGIGINTGDVVLGNIGSERKLDYTVIGDHVNLGSRLEGLTKQYGCPVIISEYTFRELEGAVPCAVLDLVQVKGKHVPIRIYWPLALPDDPPEVLETARELAELSERAFACYLRGEWSESARLYGEMPECTLRGLFTTRCQEYEKLPPPDGWDGVCTMTTK